MGWKQNKKGSISYAERAQQEFATVLKVLSFLKSSIFPCLFLVATRRDASYLPLSYFTVQEEDISLIPKLTKVSYKNIWKQENGSSQYIKETPKSY